MKEVGKKYPINQDRICWLAGEENALGRFLKEHGKSDKTKAGKMMIGGFSLGHLVMTNLIQLLGRQ